MNRPPLEVVNIFSLPNLAPIFSHVLDYMDFIVLSVPFTVKGESQCPGCQYRLPPAT